jgi:hypothetical protein
VIVHADDQQRRARRGPPHQTQPLEPGSAEHRVVEDDRVSGNPVEEAEQVRQVGSRSDRLDARLALEEAPEARPDPRVTGGDDDRHGRSRERSRLEGHGDKDRRDAGSAHPSAGLTRHP